MESQKFVFFVSRDKETTSLRRVQVNNFIQSKIASMGPDSEDPFYVLDMWYTRNLMHQWKSKLPNITPFYAVKCNPEPKFLDALGRLGAGFDCASKGEIKMVLGLGISPERIVYANPCKSALHIKYAASMGVNLTTFDSHYEIEKMKKLHPQCSLLLRIAAGDDTSARVSFGTKFGALPGEIASLLVVAQKACIPVVGVSFHVGSAVKNPETYRTAIASAKSVFDTVLQLGMPRMHILDIGGGFMDDPCLFEETSLVIKDSIKSYFGNEPAGFEVIAEPGRFFCEKSFMLVANIIGKRDRGESREYWINDGIHGSMAINMMIRDPTRVRGGMYPLACESRNSLSQGEVTHSSIVYGPTCDSADIIFKDILLPDLQINDRLVFTEMGAYAASVGSRFNGFNTSAIITYVATA